MKHTFGFLIIFISVLSGAFFAHAQTDNFDTRSVVDASLTKADTATGKIILKINDGWHVNANPASMDFLIPTEIVTSDTSKLTEVTYPIGHEVETPLGLMRVYSNETAIPFKIEGRFPESVSLTAQACDGKTCYPPSTWTVFLSAE